MKPTIGMKYSKIEIKAVPPPDLFCHDIKAKDLWEEKNV